MKVYPVAIKDEKTNIWSVFAIFANSAHAEQAVKDINAEYEAAGKSLRAGLTGTHTVLEEPWQP